MELLPPEHNRAEGFRAARSTPVYSLHAGSGSPPEDLPAHYWQQLWRIKWMVAACAAAGIAAGLLIAALQTPIYRARTSLELQMLNQNYLDMRSIDPVAGNDSLDTFLQTQIQLLGSQGLMQRTIEKVIAGQPAMITSPQPTGWRLGQVAAQPRSESTSDAAWYIARHLSVKGSGLTRLVEIVCESPHPALAAAFANTLASEYIEQNLENRWDSTRRTGDWLTRKVHELKDKLQAAEEAQQAYSVAAGLVYTSDKDSVTMEELRRLEVELSTAHMDRVKKQSRYEQAISSPSESMADVMENAEFRENRSKLVDLRRQLAEAGTTMKAEHPRMQKIDAQIGSITAELQRSRENIIRRIRNEYEEAQRRERMLGEADANQRRLLNDHLSKETRYNLLKRDVESTRMMYDSMMQKLKEVGVAGAMPANNVRIVDAAEPAPLPALPSKSLNTVLGLVFGAIGGAMLGFIRLHSNPYLKAPGEAGALLGIPEIGAVPALAFDPIRPARWIRKWIGATNGVEQPAGLLHGENGKGKGRRNRSVDLTLLSRDNSVMAEAYRAALTAILLANERRGVRTMVVASGSPREGKTSSISNLAVGLAELRKRVLLIDGDIRSPQLHEVFGVSNEFGLSELLEQPEQESKRGPVPSGVDGLYLLPAGNATGHTKNQLHSANLVKLLSAFEEEFDVVLIDTAPALHMRDARLLGSLADAVILIVRAGKTSRDAASAVAEKFRQDGTHVLGVILNDWKPVAGDTVYGHRYLNGYRRYYSRS